MALIGVLQTLVDGTIITAAQHNSNYADIKTAFNTSAVLTDVAKIVTVTHTWTASQLFSGGFSLGGPITSDLLFTDALYDIGKAGATRPRDLFLSRNLVAGGTGSFTGAGPTLSLVAAGGVTGQVLSGTGSVNTNQVRAYFSNLGGTLAWGIEKSTGSSIFTGAGAYYGVIGTDSNTPFGFASNGTIRAYFTAAGDFALTSAVSRIIPGVTSLSLRNNLNDADNLLIADNGDISVRGIMSFTTAVQPIKLINNSQIVWRNFANTQDQFGVGTDINDYFRVGVDADFAGTILGAATKKLGFFSAQGAVQQNITGSKGGNAALASVIAALVAYGMVTDAST
jgi:hypothetical protein